MKPLFILAVFLTGLTAAPAQTCPLDRVALEWAGYTLCPPKSAPPRIGKDNYGQPELLVWTEIDSFKEHPFPVGVWYLVVREKPYWFPFPTIEETQPSEFPGIREDVESLGRVRPGMLYLPETKLNGHSIAMTCNKSLSPREPDSQWCRLFVPLNNQIGAQIDLTTVLFRNAPSWPALDENWAETWPPYLADLEEALNAFFLIQ